MVSPKKKAIHFSKSDVSKVFKCRYCKKPFNQRSSLSRHQRDDCNAARLLSGKEAKPARKARKTLFHCQVCNKTFQNKRKFDLQSMVHQRTKYNCSCCGKEIKRADHLESHEKKCCHLVTVPSQVSYFQTVLALDTLDNLDMASYPHSPDTNNDDLSFHNWTGVAPSDDGNFPLELNSTATDINLPIQMQPAAVFESLCLEDDLPAPSHSVTAAAAENTQLSEDDTEYMYRLLSIGLLNKLNEKKGNTDVLLSTLHEYLGESLFNNDRLISCVIKYLGFRRYRFFFF